MKFIPLLTLLLSVTPLLAEDVAKPADAPPADGANELKPNQVEFLNLPQDVRKQFGKHLVEAHRLSQQKRIFESLDELEKGALVFAFSPEIHTLRGSCYMELRAFDKALVEFQKASSFAPQSMSIEHNIAETYFCTDEWARSLALFDKLLAKLPKTGNPFARLIEYKILLCHRKLGNTAEVTRLTDKYDYTDDSPFYYYAQASVAFEAKDVVKADEWLRMADRIFRTAGAIAPWRDTISEYGYLKGVDYMEDPKP